MQGSLRMALKGCPECGTAQMIASPVLGICEECGSDLVVLRRMTQRPAVPSLPANHPLCCGFGESHGIA